MAMLEAMKTGMAIVSMKHPTSPVINGVNGYQCESKAEIVERLKELQDNPEKTKEFGLYNQSLVNKEFSTENLLQAGEKSYRLLRKLISFVRQQVSYNRQHPFRDILNLKIALK